MGHSRGSSNVFGNLTTAQLSPAVEVNRAMPITVVGGRPDTDRDGVRELTAHEEGLRAMLAAVAMQVAVTDWGWTGLDAGWFALAVWFAVGWALRQR